MAWGRGVCSRVEGYAKTLTANQINEYLLQNGKLPQDDNSAYVALFKQVAREDLTDICSCLGGGFTSHEMASISGVFTSVKWWSVRHVFTRYLRIGIENIDLKTKEFDLLIEAYRNVMRQLFLCVPSKRQVVSIFEASNSFYFADLGTGG